MAAARAAAMAPVGALGAPLDFGALAGRDAYEAVVGGAYARLGSAWLTPAEIFRPWYGYAVGEYLVHLWESEEAGFRGHPMRVYEVGGGRGTAARDVLDYIRAAAPHLYADMRMTSVEVAPPLAAAQRRAVAAAPDGHAHKHAVLEGDASDPELWGGRDEAPCAVVALEVFDNLVHDKITRVRGEWHEALVEETLVPAGVQGGSRVQRAERTRPLQDERIRRVLQLREDIRPATGGIRMERLFRWEESVWLPTGCLQLLRALHERRPHHALVAADFSRLPPAGGVVGEMAPVVASKSDGVNTDHSTYLVEPGTADIFFPTDFHLLKKMWLESALEDAVAQELKEKAAEHDDSKLKLKLALPRSVAMTQDRFMATFADASRCRLGDGYNPLLEDFGNAAFFLSHGLPKK
eukprot:PRCOL_00005088-RA